MSGTIDTAVERMASYAGRTLTTTAREEYVRALAGLDEGAVVDACVRWMRAHAPGAMLPSPQELRGVVREATHSAATAQARDATPTWTVLERAGRGKYQKAVARLMQATLTATEPAKAKLYRAFAAEWHEEQPWMRLAEYAEADPVIRDAMIRDDEAERRRVERMERARAAATAPARGIAGKAA